MALFCLVGEFQLITLNTVALMKTYPGPWINPRGPTHPLESELTFHSELKLLVVD